jgi:hypothetical protein
MVTFRINKPIDRTVLLQTNTNFIFSLDYKFRYLLTILKSCYWSDNVIFGRGLIFFISATKICQLFIMQYDLVYGVTVHKSVRL